MDVRFPKYGNNGFGPIVTQRRWGAKEFLRGALPRASNCGMMCGQLLNLDKLWDEYGITMGQMMPEYSKSENTFFCSTETLMPEKNILPEWFSHFFSAFFFGGGVAGNPLNR